ncbi:MAG: N-acyl amino acid synthase FeeM domain-containing protein [Pirellulales bacterium]
MPIAQLAPKTSDFQIADLVYKVAANQSERETAFRLVYQAYTRAGLIEPNPYEMRVTPYHLFPTTAVFVAIYRGDIICTVSLIGDGELGLPMEAIYAGEVARLREQGFFFGEVSALADRRRHVCRVLPIFVKLTRLMAQYARRNGMHQLLVAVHPRHARFYQRYMGFEPIGGEKAYPMVRNHPAVALCLDFAHIDWNPPDCYQEFFGEWAADEELECRPMSDEEHHFFRPAAEICGQVSPMLHGDVLVADGPGNREVYASAG